METLVRVDLEDLLECLEYCLHFLISQMRHSGVTQVLANGEQKWNLVYKEHIANTLPWFSISFWQSLP
jgi:hypothetical protein